MNDTLRGLIMAAIQLTIPALVSVGVINWDAQQISAVESAVIALVLLGAYFIKTGQSAKPPAA